MRGLRCLLVLLLLAAGAPGLPGAEPAPGDAATIVGRVHQDGEPVARATLAVRAVFQASDMPSTLTPYDAAVGSAPMDALLGRGALLETLTTKRDGRFSIGVPEAGAYVLHCTAGSIERMVVVLVPRLADVVRADVDMAPGPTRVRVRARAQERVAVGWRRPNGDPFVLLEGLPARRIPADESGVFEQIPRVPCRVSLILDSGRSGGVPHNAGDPKPVDLRPRKPWRSMDVQVRVTNTSGAPVAGAHVAAHGESASGRTDETGAVSLAIMPLGRTAFWISAPGHATRRAEFELALDDDAPQTASFDVELTKESVLAGRLMGGNQRLANAWVQAIRLPKSQRIGMLGPPTVAFWSLLPKLMIAQTRTDAQGRFTLRGLQAGHYVLAHHSAGWVSDHAAMPHVWSDSTHLTRIDTGRTHEAVVRCVPTVGIAGRVLDPRGDPIAGVQVLARAQTAYLSLTAAATTTDAKGAFRLRGIVPDITYVVSAVSPERGDAQSGAMYVRSGETGRVELTMPDPAYLDATVRIWPERRPGAATAIGLRPAERDPVRRLTVHMRDDPVFVTDAQGRVRIGPIPAGAWVIEPFGLDYFGSSFRHVVAPFPPSGGTRRIDLDIGKDTSFSGRVVLPPGASMEAVDLDVDQADGGIAFHYPDKQPDGSFVVRANQPGPYRVRAWLRHAGDLYEHTVQANGNDTDVRIELVRYRPAKGSGEWLVRATHADGRPVTRGRVWTIRRRAKDDDPLLGPRQYLPGRSYEIRGGVAALTPRSLVGMIDLAPGGPQDTWFVVSDDRDEEDPSPHFGTAVVGPSRENGGTVSVRVPAPRTLMGVVRDEAGTPQAGVPIGVELYHWEEADTTAVHRAESGEDGRFSVQGLGPYRYRLFLKTTPPGYVPHEPQTIDPDARDVAVTLRRGKSYTLRFLDADGTPVPAVTVKLRPHGWSANNPYLLHVEGEQPPKPQPKPSPGIEHIQPIVAYSDDRGVAVLEGVDPAKTYDLAAEGPRDAFRWDQIYEDAWKPTDQTFRFPAPKNIEVDVRTADGEPVPAASVWYAGPDLAWQRVANSSLPATQGPFGPQDDGYSIFTPKYQTYFVWAAAQAWKRPPTDRTSPAWQRVVQAKPGRERVRLVVDPGLVMEIRVRDLPVGRSAWITVTDPLGGSLANPVEIVTSSGRARVFGRKAGPRYAVYIRTVDGAQCAWVADAEAGPPIDVTLRAAAQISGRATWPDGVEASLVRVAALREGVKIPGVMRPDGTFVIDALVPGPYEVVVWEESSEARYAATIETETGAHVLVTLAKR